VAFLKLASAVCFSDKGADADAFPPLVRSDLTADMSSQGAAANAVPWAVHWSFGEAVLNTSMVNRFREWNKLVNHSNGNCGRGVRRWRLNGPFRINWFRKLSIHFE
jgi:hypothetical protein